MKFIVKIILSLQIISSCLFLNMRKPTNSVEYLNNLFEEKADNLPKESLNLNRIISHSITNQQAATQNSFSFKENAIKNKNKSKKRINNNQNELKAQERLESSYPSESEELSEESNEEPEDRTESEAFAPEAAKSTSSNKFEGWLKIKSESFINSRLFPSDQVKFDNDFFRVNNLNEKQKDKFYFTLSGKFLQYKSDEKSLNLLQVIRLESIESLKYYPIIYDVFGASALHCADFLEKYDDLYTNFYKICSENLAEFNKFFCALAQTKSLKFPQCQETKNLKPQTELEVEIQNAQMLIPLPSKFCNENFNYKNHGEDWECLCKEGLNQSPIDLPKPKNAVLSAVTPIFEFEEIQSAEALVSQVGLPKKTLRTQIKFENEVLKISKNNFGKIITLDSEVFTAIDIIFHTPSEHTIEGKRFDMEMQVVYSNNLGRSAVLVFLFEKKAGYFNKFLDDIDFYDLPNRIYKTKNILNKLFIPKIFSNNLNSEKDFDKNNFASAKPFSFYTYEGSITQPPCSEEAVYYIASEPLPIAGITIQLAQEALKSIEGNSTGFSEESAFLASKDNHILGNKNAEGSYRVTQKLNGRKVYFYDHKKFSNHLSNIIVKVPEKEGHIEKMKINKRKVIYVESDKPSGIPGALVLGEDELLS